MKVSLAIDNCFAMKRWTRPEEWMRLTQEFGLHFVEASADNEIDPLYSTPEALSVWRAEVKELCAAYDVRVANLYSGHGTYCTLGLAHPDAQVRAHMKQDWLKPMIQAAGELGAGMGFYVHAFAESVLNDPAVYAETYDALIADLRELAEACAAQPMGPFGVEQMYSPHQVPWTVQGTEAFLRDANAQRKGAPIYITLDTGHQVGQTRFGLPSSAQLRAFYTAANRGERLKLHLGTRTHYLQWLERALSLNSAEAFEREFTDFAKSHAYMFSQEGDGDPYRWLEHFGCYSPIIHLQQTDGNSSAHKSFTQSTNATGIINAPDVLRALAQSCSRPEIGDLPKLEHVYLTLEIFLPTACDPREALDEIAESAAYWRQFVPRDGMELDEILDLCAAMK